jgi:hypothetical protein
MRPIKNANGKTVCEVDTATKTVEIVHKGFKTVVRFTTDGRVEIENTKPAA